MGVQRTKSPLPAANAQVFRAAIKLSAAASSSSLPMSFKENDKDLIAWYKREIAKEGIEVRFNTEINDPNTLRGFDEVIVATGSVPRTMGLLARAQVAQGKAAAALESVESLRQKYVDSGQTRFLANIDALICRVKLRLGDDEAVQRWLETEAPKNEARLWAMWRYQYLTRVMVRASMYVSSSTVAPDSRAPLKCFRTQGAERPLIDRAKHMS